MNGLVESSTLATGQWKSITIKLPPLVSAFQSHKTPVTDNSIYCSKFNMPFKLPQVGCTGHRTNKIYTKRVFTSPQNVISILNIIPWGSQEDNQESEDTSHLIFPTS